MRKTTVVKLNGGRFIDAFNQNSTLILMLFSVLLGVLLGALRVKNSTAEGLIAFAEDFINFLSARQSLSFIKMLPKALLLWLPYVAAAFLCGTSLAGMATVPLVCGYFGYTYGTMAAYLYSNFAMQGIGFCMLLVIPARIIAAFALMLACRESFAFSLMMAKLILQTKGATHTYFNFKNYCLRYLFILMLLAASTLVDCLFFKGFGKFFSF